jgi:predicted RecB family endonuclease
MAKQFIGGIATQLSPQLLALTVMASNVIPEMVVEIAKAAGMNEKDAKVLEYIMMAITMLLMIFFSVAGQQGLKNIVTTIREGLMEMGRGIQQAASNALELIDTMIKNIMKGIKESHIELQQMVQQILENLKQLKNSIGNLPNSIADAYSSSISNLKDSIERFEKALKETIRGRALDRYEMYDMDGNLIKDTKTLQKILENKENVQIYGSKGWETVTDDAQKILVNELKLQKHILKDAVDAFVKAMKDLTDKLLTTAVAVKDTIIEELKAAIRQLETVAKEAAKKMAEEGNKAAQEVLGGLEVAVDAAKGLKRFCIDLKNMAVIKYFKEATTPEEIANQIKEIEGLKQLAGEDLYAGGTALHNTLQLTNMALVMGNGVVEGVFGLQVYKLLDEVKDIRYSQDVLTALIDMMEKLLKSLQAGIDANSEFIVNLQRALFNFYQSQSRNTSKIFQMQG